MKYVFKYGVLLFGVLTPLFALKFYPDVNGAFPLLIWLVAWAAFLTPAATGAVAEKQYGRRFINYRPSEKTAKRLRILFRIIFAILCLVAFSRSVVFAGFAYLLSPYALPVIVIISLIVFAAGRFRPLAALVSAIVFIWAAAIFSLGYVRIPSTNSTCADLDLPDYASALFVRNDLRGLDELRGALPYEAQIIGDSALVTFKNLHGRGAVGRFFFDTRPPKILSLTNSRYPLATIYPERICLDPDRKIAFTSTKTLTWFEIFRADYSGDGLRALPPIMTPDEETTNCVWDAQTKKLGVLFLQPRPSWRTYSLPHGPGGPPQEEKPYWKTERDIFSDYAYLDKSTSRIFIATGWFPENKLVELDLTKGTAKERIFCNSWFGCFHPLGIDGATDPNQFFLSDPINSEVGLLDLEIGEIVKTAPSGRFPRKISYDRQTDLLFTAAYAGGSVDIFRGEKLEPVASVALGRLVRSVAFDPNSGKTIAASSCGVFLFDNKKIPGGVDPPVAGDNMPMPPTSTTDSIRPTDAD